MVHRTIDDISPLVWSTNLLIVLFFRTLGSHCFRQWRLRAQHVRQRSTVFRKPPASPRQVRHGGSAPRPIEVRTAPQQLSNRRPRKRGGKRAAVRREREPEV